MGLQDWLDKAAPATGLLKGARGSSPNDMGSFQQPEGPAISRFTGLPVVPARLNLTRDPSTEAPVMQSTFVETPFPEASLPHAAPPSPQVTLPDATFTMDTDDLTDFHPLYPSTTSATTSSAPTITSPQEAFSFSNESATVSYTAPMEEAFYVAPAETFVTNEPNPSAAAPGNFAWPNALDDSDVEDSEPWQFTSATAPETAWEAEEGLTHTEPSFSHEEAHEFSHALAPEDEDPFGLNDASDPFGLSSPPTSESFTDTMSLDGFGMELLSPTVPASQESHDEPSMYDPFTSDPLDADVFGHTALPELAAFSMDDLHPLYPVDEQAFLSPSMTIEPPDPEPLPTWEEQQPWVTRTEDASPLDVSPLHLLDPIEHDTFSSDWGLTLPESLEMHHNTLEHSDLAEEQEVWDFSEPLSSHATMDETVDLFHPESSPLSLYTEEAPPIPLTPTTEEPLIEDWQGFTNSVTQYDDGSLNPTLDNLNLDDSWLHEAVPEDFIATTPSPPLPQPEEPLPATVVQASVSPPLAQAITKNGRMSVSLVPSPTGEGILLQAQAFGPRNEETSLHCLKRFAKNPLHSMGPSTPMTLTEEARLKGKTLYRIELGNWRGIFSHSEKQGFVFQDEWQSE